MTLREHLVAVRLRLIEDLKKIDEILADFETAKAIPAAKAEIQKLTKREGEIFDLIAQGMEIGEIADKLKRSKKTIEAHRETIRKKMGCETASELKQIARGEIALR